MTLFRSATTLALALGLAVLAPAAMAQNDTDVAAKVGSKSITIGDLRKAAASQLSKIRQQEYDILDGQLQQMIDDALLDAAAVKVGKTKEQLLTERVESKVPAPSDAEVQKFFDDNKARMGGRTLDQVKPQIAAQLQQQQKQKLYMELVEGLRKETPVEIKLDPPRAQVSADDDPARGPEKAPVTLIMFSDYQCPFCSRVEETMKRIKDSYGDLVRFVFRDYPLSFHNRAQKAAEAAGCAYEQGNDKFWKMHDTLFANQRALESDNILSYAKDVGLDMDKFKACWDGGKRAAEISKDMSDGTAVGVTGTPASFVNGRFVSGAQPFENFQKLIDGELRRVGITPPTPKPAPAPVNVAPPAAAAPVVPAGQPAQVKPAPAQPAPAAPAKPDAKK